MILAAIGLPETIVALLYLRDRWQSRPSRLSSELDTLRKEREFYLTAGRNGVTLFSKSVSTRRIERGNGIRERSSEQGQAIPARASDDG